MKVSLVTPIYERPEFRAILQKIIDSQIYTDFEWIVCEEQESYNNNTRLKADYIIVDKKLNIAEKRNLLCKKASGDIILQLDMDDFYSSNYVEKTVELYEQDIVAHSSSQMYFYRITNNTYDLFETTGSWGASLSYRKEVCDRIPFQEHKIRGEERLLIKEIKALYGNKYIETDTLLQDILVILHNNNTSTKNPTNTHDNKTFLQSFVGKEFERMYNEICND